MEVDEIFDESLGITDSHDRTVIDTPPSHADPVVVAPPSQADDDDGKHNDDSGDNSIAEHVSNPTTSTASRTEQRDP